MGAFSWRVMLKPQPKAGGSYTIKVAFSLPILVRSPPFLLFPLCISLYFHYLLIHQVEDGSGGANGTLTLERVTYGDVTGTPGHPLIRAISIISGSWRTDLRRTRALVGSMQVYFCSGQSKCGGLAALQPQRPWLPTAPHGCQRLLLLLLLLPVLLPVPVPPPLVLLVLVLVVVLLLLLRLPPPPATGCCRCGDYCRLPQHGTGNLLHFLRQHAPEGDPGRQALDLMPPSASARGRGGRCLCGSVWCLCAFFMRCASCPAARGWCALPLLFVPSSSHPDAESITVRVGLGWVGGQASTLGSGIL